MIKISRRLVVGGLLFALATLVVIWGPAVLAAAARNLGLLWLHRGLLSADSPTVEHGLHWLEQSANWRASIGALRGLALASHAVGNAQGAERAITRAESLSPQDPLVLWTAGQLALEQGERERAIEHWRRAGAGRYLTLQARSILDAGRLDEAQAAIELALAVDAHQADTWLVLGDLHCAQGKWEQAADDYWRAIELAPDLALAYLGLARAYREQGKTAQALAVLEEGVRRAPRQVSLYNTAAEILRQAGHPDHALAWCERGQRAVPEHWILYFCSGITYRQLGEMEPAIGQFYQAVEYGADRCGMQYWIGISYRDLGQFEAAVMTLEGAKCGNANIPWVYIEQARTYEQMGRPDLALAEYQAVLDLFPASEWAVQAAREGIRRLTGVEQP